MPISPAAISRSAVTPGLFLVSTLGAWPWLHMRARYVAASTSWKRFGILTRQSSTVMRAMRAFSGDRGRPLGNRTSEQVEGREDSRLGPLQGRVLEAL